MNVINLVNSVTFITVDLAGFVRPMSFVLAL